MTETTAIGAMPREATAQANRRLAAAGHVPAVLYGHGREALSLAVDRHEFDLFMAHHAVAASLIELRIEGESKPVNAMIKEVQVSPIKGNVLHIDFVAISMNKPVQAPVNLHFVGDSVGVKAGGVFLHDVNQVNVEALPKDLPTSIDIDITALEIGSTLHISDVVAPAGVTILDDPENIIGSITVPSAEPVEDEEAAEVTEPALIGEETEESEE